MNHRLSADAEVTTPDPYMSQVATILTGKVAPLTLSATPSQSLSSPRERRGIGCSQQTYVSGEPARDPQPNRALRLVRSGRAGRRHQLNYLREH